MAIPKELLGYVVSFDTETATLGDHVCEIGFSIFNNGELVTEIGTFVKPAIPIEPGASNVHHIYDDDVEDFPPFAEIAWWVHNQLSMADAHIAYNYEYDRKVLIKEFSRLGMEFPVRPMADPLVYFRKFYKYNKGKKLINAAEKLGIPLIGAHRAQNDATAAARVLFKIAHTRVSFPKSLPKLLEQQRKLVQEQFEDLRDYFKSQGRELPTEPDYSLFEL